MFDDEVDVSRKFRNVRIDGAVKPSKEKNTEEDGNEYRHSSEREFHVELNTSVKWKYSSVGTTYGGKDFNKGNSEQATSSESNQASAPKFLTINPAVCRKSSTSSLPPIEEEAAFCSITIPPKKVSFNDLPLSPQKLSQMG